MAEEKSKLIPFTKHLEDVIEADAKRCHRSFVRQVTAVLMAYYRLEDVELNKDSLQFVGELYPKSKKKMQLLETKNKKKKAG